MKKVRGKGNDKGRKRRRKEGDEMNEYGSGETRIL